MSLPPAYPRRAVWGTAGRLRAWQEEALRQYFDTEPDDFLAAATPGAGKTTFALRLASELLDRGTVRQVFVVVPTEHLKKQWADAAHRIGMPLNPAFRNADGGYGSGFRGAVVTYAQVAAAPEVLGALVASRPALAILDEIHHAGDALSWGDALRSAVGRAVRRVSLTGTPFRSDTSPIPFVTYVPDSDGVRISHPDYSYGYGRALSDGVVRPVIFMSYSGTMHWRTRVGDEFTADLGGDETKDVTAQAWRTALEPSGQWIKAVLGAADHRLSEVRRGVPDAAGLVVASDQNAARAYAKVLRSVTGEAATVVLSDDPGASRRIASFADSSSRWLVAVRMVSEGVDIPRLAVGVYATSASTPLFFSQLVGRFVRARRRGEVATIFLPSVPVLLALAGDMETERDHVLDIRSAEEDASGWDDLLVEQANREEKASSMLADEGGFEALDATATLDRVLFEGGEVGVDAEAGSEEELGLLGMPGILEPEQVRELLAAHRARKPGGARKKHVLASPSTSDVEKPLYERIAAARSELNRLVAIHAASTGEAHARIHSVLRRTCGGPPVAKASLAEIQERIATIRRWMRH